MEHLDTLYASPYVVRAIDNHQKSSAHLVKPHSTCHVIAIPSTVWRQTRRITLSFGTLRQAVCAVAFLQIFGTLTNGCDRQESPRPSPRLSTTIPRRTRRDIRTRLTEAMERVILLYVLRHSYSIAHLLSKLSHTLNHPRKQYEKTN